MEDLRDEIWELRQRTNQNLRQFLETDMQTCFIAVERGQLELSLGDSDEAQKELGTASHGADVIEGFLRKADQPMEDIGARLVDLRAALDSLRQNIEKAAPRPG